MASDYIEYVHVTKHPSKITEQQGSTVPSRWYSPRDLGSFLVAHLYPLEQPLK